MKNHVENSKKFELDKLLIKKIYNIKEKNRPEYKVIKKNVIHDKQLTRQYYKYLDVNKSNYYSIYQTFREYLSSGYNSGFLVNEMNNIKSIIDYSQNIRKIAEKKLININQQSQRINKPSINPAAYRRQSAVFPLDLENIRIQKMANLGNKSLQPSSNIQPKKFIDNCTFLKLKEAEMKNQQTQYQFRLYSMLSEEYDKLLLPSYENFMKVKYENQQASLINIYNKEKAFVNQVIAIKDKLKSYVKYKENKRNQEMSSDSLRIRNNNSQSNSQNEFISSFQNIPQFTPQLKVPYVNAFFFGRTDTYFKDIDNFMSMYKENTSLASKRLEKDFF